MPFIISSSFLCGFTMELFVVLIVLYVPLCTLRMDLRWNQRWRQWRSEMEKGPGVTKEKARSEVFYARRNAWRLNKHTLTRLPVHTPRQGAHLGCSLLPKRTSRCWGIFRVNFTPSHFPIQAMSLLSFQLPREIHLCPISGAAKTMSPAVRNLGRISSSTPLVPHSHWGFPAFRGMQLWILEVDSNFLTVEISEISWNFLKSWRSFPLFHILSLTSPLSHPSSPSHGKSFSTPDLQHSKKSASRAIRNPTQSGKQPIFQLLLKTSINLSKTPTLITTSRLFQRQNLE